MRLVQKRSVVFAGVMGLATGVLTGNSGLSPIIASILEGDDGNDILVVNGSGNTVDGGAGDDRLTSWGGNSSLSGGDGNDVLSGVVSVIILNGASCAVLFGREKYEAANNAKGRLVA
jgi:Ca2+-binding RTX toxin-like protein